jgi:hypothetical protein
MKISDCGNLFTASLSTVRVLAPEYSPFNRIAVSVLGMARAYESDGITFLKSGEPVNALAGFFYGMGWLHFGLSSGLLATSAPPVCPFSGTQEILQPLYTAKLEEKAYRYAHLLDTALFSVKSAPDPATISYDFAERIHSVALVYYKYGNYYLKSGWREEALANFSYGHGWLDAGVTAGFFRIVAERDLFTV